MFKMSQNILKLENNVNTIYNLISYIQKELNHVVQLSNENTLKHLTQENAVLEKQVDQAKARLMQLQGNAGLLSNLVKCESVLAEAHVKQESSKPAATESSADKPKSDKPAKTNPPKPTASANKPADKADDGPVDIGRLDLRVGKILEASKHPDADSLYVEKVELGEAAPRTVVSGLVKFVPIEQMQNRMVVLLCNLKPAKMRGVTSEAMVMCASTPDKVEILAPPAGSKPGDLIHVEGYVRNPDPVLNPKKKIFETVAPDLKTNEQNQATYRGVPWKIENVNGFVTSQSLANVNIK
uniref:Aminoacyl tRNA synthase complex-interacting multifunctional protein 1 n=1 Tax=Cacopsylla melanoneura TaxID=428564 RepID=A0A8D8Y6F3_9HEMI